MDDVGKRFDINKDMYLKKGKNGKIGCNEAFSARQQMSNASVDSPAGSEAVVFDETIERIPKELRTIPGTEAVEKGEKFAPDGQFIHLFKILCLTGCEPMEIAEYFDTTVKALDLYCTRFMGMSLKAAIERYTARRNRALRRKMYEVAFGTLKRPPDTKMLIWLSKQHLGMKDQVDVKTENTNKFVLEKEDVVRVTVEAKEFLRQQQEENRKLINGYITSEEEC